MATYIQGLSDYVPQVQPFKPDFNFYQNVLQRKQQQYDVGFQQVSSIYNSILNAPMLRDGNVQKRDEFFKSAEMQIQRLSGVDLSLPQNVESAYGVFKPFYEDKNIINDISWTKKYQDELGKAESFRNCTDEKTCGGKYWDGGVRALNYRANEFREASDSEALGMRSPTYTPYKNVMKMATQSAKDSGLSVKYDEIQGGYIVTTKNGQKLEAPLMTYFMQTFGDDPEVQSFYQTKAYLLRKENPEAAQHILDKGLEDPKDSEDPKTMDAKISTVTYEKEASYIHQKTGEESNRLDVLLQKKAAMDKLITKKGIDPESNDGKDYIQLLEDIEAQKRFTTKLGTTSDRANEVSVNNQQFGPNYDQMEGVIGQSLMLKDISAAAHTLAYRDFEQTRVADPFAVQARAFSNSITLQKMRFLHDEQMTEVKNTNDKRMKLLDTYLKEGIVDIDNLDLVLGNDPLDQEIRKHILQNSTPKVSSDSDINISDTKLAEEIKNGVNPTKIFGEYKGKFLNLTTNNGASSLPIKQQIGKDYLSSIFNNAIDGSSNPDAELSRAELTYMGNRIHYNLDQFEKDMKAGKRTPLSDLSPTVIQKLRQWPSDTKNSKNINPKFFASMKDYLDEAVDVIGGDVSFYRYITENKGNIGAKSKVSSIKDQFDDNAKMISYANVLDQSKKKAIQYFNTAGEKAAKELIGSTGYGSSDDWYEKFIAKNLWIGGDNENFKYGKMASKSDLYNKLLSRPSPVDVGSPKDDLGPNKIYNLQDFESSHGFKADGDVAAKILFSSYHANIQDVKSLASSLAKKTGKKLPEVSFYDTGDSERKKYSDFITSNLDKLDINRSNNNLSINTGEKSFNFNLSGAAVPEKYVKKLREMDSRYDNVAKQFLNNYQGQESPFSSTELGKGSGSFTSKELAFNVSPFVKNETYRNGLEVAQEIVNRRSSIEGNGNTDLLNEWLQDIGPGKQWSKSAKGLPTTFMEIKPISGDIYHSEVSITFNDNYLQSKGYNKYNRETGLWDANPTPKVQVFRIKNSESQVIKKSKPDPFTVLLANKGDNYTENASGDENTPKFTYTNVGNDNIKVTLDTPIFDVETGKYWNPVTEPIMISKSSTDWQDFHSQLLDQINQVNAVNRDNLEKYNHIMGTTVPQSLGQ